MFPALSVYPQVGIFLTAWETDVRFYLCYKLFVGVYSDSIDVEKVKQLVDGLYSAEEEDGEETNVKLPKTFEERKQLGRWHGLEVIKLFFMFSSAEHYYWFAEHSRIREIAEISVNTEKSIVLLTKHG